ncbi:MAG: tRNA 2-thiocytidine biosynthesis TtcA family protein [Chlamydiae bacterium]|nr:tRNA 2-thiocytidine biosynthesis TtcA family protein [Chlamydiota bacterium]
MNLFLSFPIAQPPWTKLGRKLESMCRSAIYTFELLQGVDHLAIALSGGKDSLALLFLLKAIVGKGTPLCKISAIHISGEFSCGPSFQKNYLQSICKELEVPFYSQESAQKIEELECYSCSRERRKLIFEMAKQIGAMTIAFGHHRDDSIQTLLMNLFHKGEFAAILPKVPMAQYGITIIRPLIYISEDDIREFAQLHGFAKITCECPIGQNSMRRKTDDLIQKIEELFPNVRQNLSHASLKYGSKKAIEQG